ncbi:DNA (cytosine-5)-methyltransferase 1A-like [Triticum aestivum]|uniref:DNA (cytosine-5)-methyltransferase 1A-like n=1 Tax=Triticum aestivum TaxID=4565 RepID=UPI001D02C532|nr:DNA (cytosine-5)-methyltransferase 1A-like [Triticum aestivum]
MSVPVVMIEGKREVTTKNDLPNSNLTVVVEHAFYCEHLYDPDTGALKQLPTNVKLATLTRKAHAAKENKDASHTKWAIGYEEPDRQAFGENNREALTLLENCNVILKLWARRQTGGQPLECRGRVVQMIE